jgi:hypothetical protein
MDNTEMPSFRYIGTDQKEHVYYPDIYIKRLNLIIEVKGKMLLDMDFDKISLQLLAVSEAGYEVECPVYHVGKKKFTIKVQDGQLIKVAVFFGSGIHQSVKKPRKQTKEDVIERLKSAGIYDEGFCFNEEEEMPTVRSVPMICPLGHRFVIPLAKMLNEGRRCSNTVCVANRRKNSRSKNTSKQ